MLKKKCFLCGREYGKKNNESLKTWKSRKYCTVKCSNKARMGKHFSSKTEFKKGNNAGKHSNHLNGKDNPAWKGGKVDLLCKCCGEKLRVDLHRKDTAKFCSTDCLIQYRKNDKEYKKKMSEIQREKVKNGEHNLYNGYTDLRDNIKKSWQYKDWRKQVFQRDNYKCVLCDEDGRLNCDHYPKTFSEIIKSNNVKSLEDALNCKELWDIENGRTLCVPCHKKTDSYGVR